MAPGQALLLQSGSNMVWKKHEYEKIPGTYVFDGKTSHAAYPMNKLLYSFNHEENRQAFAENPEAYTEKFGLSDEQKEAIVNYDFLKMLQLGANIYFLAKLAVPRGYSIQDAGAAFQGITTEEFQANLDSKAEGLEEKLEEIGGFWNG